LDGKIMEKRAILCKILFCRNRGSAVR